jgi:cystathionine beta-lyase family protein involved in aluminum resistance
MVPTGGYVIGREHYVQAAFKRLSAPGVEGGEL